MTDSLKQALCCICGSLRTCRRPRNYRSENFWLSGPIDRDWHREVGDLKCEACGRVTTHAIIQPEKDVFRDHAEMMQRVATGNNHGHFNATQLDEVAEKFRRGTPRNPYLRHYWYRERAEEAWDAGRRTVKGLCGEPMTLDRDPRQFHENSSGDQRWDDDQQFKPMTVREVEYEDSETGLWWTESDCVDCLRVWHLQLLAQRRKELGELMTHFMADLLADNAGYPKKIDLRTVNTLIEALESARRQDTTESEGAAR